MSEQQFMFIKLLAWTRLF